MSSRSYDMSIFHRILQKTCGNKTGSMCHIDPQNSSYLICNFPHPLIVPLSRICRSSTYNKFRMTLYCPLLHSIIIDISGSFIKSVRNRIVKNTRHVNRGAMSKMTSLRQIESHKCISRFKYSHHNCHIGLCSGMRLDIGILGIINLAQSVNSQLLNLINHLATAIISLSGVTFCIFVGTYRPHCFHNLSGDIVFRSYKL